ncbi:MAG TPA: zinc-dependent metalloprotease [Solirubrobacteraceae bacterium]|nr:zinc-dependent metalloprotease [Solirubrobacteraceae bacterium]
MTTALTRTITPGPAARPPAKRGPHSVIDWIIAEKIASYVAGEGDAREPTVPLGPLAADAAERVVAYTRLQPQRELPPPEGISRREWVAANLRSMRRMLDPVLERAGEKLGSPRGARSLGVSVVSTTEVGIVVGFLAQRVLGQYELVLLEEASADNPPRLLFVLPNLSTAVRTLRVPSDEFLTWVTLHEVTHAVQFSAVPWLQPHMAGLVSELLRSMELRIDGPRRLPTPSVAEARRIATAVRHGDIIGIFASEGERATIDRVQATMAVIEGHAEHVMDAVAPELLPSLPKLRSALDRRRRSQSGRARLLAKLLGLEMKMRQYEQGKVFCDEVVRRAGTDALVAVFSAPEALPTLAELADPPAWLMRMGLPT